MLDVNLRLRLVVVRLIMLLFARFVLELAVCGVMCAVAAVMWLSVSVAVMFAMRCGRGSS